MTSLCPQCATPGVYNSGFTLECVNRGCSFFSQRQLELHQDTSSNDSIISVYQCSNGICLYVAPTIMMDIDITERGDGHKIGPFAPLGLTQQDITFDYCHLFFDRDPSVLIDGPCNLSIGVMDKTKYLNHKLVATLLTPTAPHESTFESMFSNVHVAHGHRMIFMAMACEKEPLSNSKKIMSISVR